MHSSNFFGVYKLYTTVKYQNIRRFINLKQLFEKACPGDKLLKWQDLTVFSQICYARCILQTYLMYIYVIQLFNIKI